MDMERWRRYGFMEGGVGRGRECRWVTAVKEFRKRNGMCELYVMATLPLLVFLCEIVCIKQTRTGTPADRCRVLKRVPPLKKAPPWAW